MPKEALDIANFDLYYQTPEHIPAPYSYYYQIEGKMKGDKLHVHYRLFYTDREELTQDEIEGEGFTMNDNYEWTGELSATWAKAITKQLQNCKLTDKMDDSEDCAIYIKLTDNKDQLREGIPADTETIEYLAQELTQAVFEASGKEMPLIIKLKKVNQDRTFTSVTLRISFSERKATVTTVKNQAGEIKKDFSWQNLKDLLNITYLPEYIHERALEKEPHHPGTYIDSGEGIWYKFGDGVKNPGPDFNVLKKIEEKILSL